MSFLTRTTTKRLLFQTTRLYTGKCRIEYKKEPEFKISYYKDLSKAKLASFVLISTMAGYALAPGMGSVAGLLNVTVGTGLCIASANTFNQWIEIPYDSQMSRTRNRLLPRHAISPTHAFIAGTLSGVLGTSILSAVNPYCALLGFSNIILYSFVYTPMKRTSIYNTWVGSIVGAVPPVIGWVACTGTFDTGSMILAGILYSWQFPHFNALSWNLRPDYAKAGYQMMSVLDPLKNSLVSLRHSIFLLPLCFGFYYYGIESIWFLVDSSLLNAYLTFYAFRFWKHSNDKSARKLFFASLIYLPTILTLLLIHKENGLFEYFNYY